MQTYRKKVGNWAENVVCRQLIGRAYRVISRQWHCRCGEIDIIAYDPGGVLVFIEVRSKTTDDFGRPEDSIGRRKKRSLERSIAAYIMQSGYAGDYRCDVWTVEKKQDGKKYLKHLRNVRLE